MSGRLSGPAPSDRRARRTGLTLAALLAILVTGTAYAAVGGLAQKPGTAGCISETGTAGACVDGTALDNVGAVTISPDGTSAYATSLNSDAVSIFDRDPATGALTQKPGAAGCISDSGTGGACVDGTELDSPHAVTVSPDGASVYVASFVFSIPSPDNGAVAIFDRNPATGALAQKPGPAGCISESGTGGTCVDGTGLGGATSVTVSPDGTSAYVASSIGDAVAVFDRNPNSGALTQKPGTAGCISETGTSGACVDGSGLDSPASVTVSPDGASAYAVSLQSRAVAIFDRSTSTGDLTQKPGTSGCISETGTSGACVDGSGLDGPFSVTVSPDGASAYAASVTSDSVAIFDRDATGALTQKAGTSGCISETGSAGACVDGTALDEATSVAVSPDGTSAYVTSETSDALAILDRDPVSGALTQKPGTAGCISETGSSGACVDGSGLDAAFSVAVSPDGASAYVAARTSDALTIFDRDLPPETTIASGPSGTTDDSTPTFEFSSTDPGSSFECKVDEAPFGPCSGPGASHTTNALADGPRTFAVRAIDPASNADPTPATRAFTIDTKVDDGTDEGACADAKAKLKKAQGKLKKARAKLKKARASGNAAKLKKARAKAKKAKKKVNRAKAAVGRSC